MRKAIITATVFIIISLIISLIGFLPGMTRETTFQYYGFDYAGIFFVLIAQKLLETKDKRAFIVYIIGLILNSIFGYIIASFSVVLFSVYSGWIFIQNYRKWAKDEKS